jgi:hypothetical protein
MKIALFVEGFTEMLLIKNIVLYNYGEANVSFHLYKLRGGNKFPVRVTLREEFEATSGTPTHIFYIYDCGGLSTIRSMIDHQRTSLHKNDFNKIIGIRDVHPEDRSAIPLLKRQLPYRVPQKPIPTSFLLCVMETEAWFIAEGAHYEKISPSLTKEFILEKTGIDIDTFDVESFDAPADKLNEIYSHAGEVYDKTEGNIKRTVDAIEIINLIEILSKKIPGLEEVLSEILV